MDDTTGGGATLPLLFTYMGYRTMKPLLNDYMHDEAGTTNMEYAFIAACIFLFIIISLKFLSNNLNNKFNQASENLT